MSIHLSATRVQQLGKLGYTLFPGISKRAPLLNQFILGWVGEERERELELSVSVYLKLYFDTVDDYVAGDARISLVNRAKARLYREIDYALRS